jgi:hypothetical protein
VIQALPIPPHAIELIPAGRTVLQEMAQDQRIPRGASRFGGVPQKALEILDGRMIPQHINPPKAWS